jgi:hypothetical protein
MYRFLLKDLALAALPSRFDISTYWGPSSNILTVSLELDDGQSDK